MMTEKLFVGEFLRFVFLFLGVILAAFGIFGLVGATSLTWSKYVWTAIAVLGSWFMLLAFNQAIWDIDAYPKSMCESFLARKAKKRQGGNKNGSR